jgi:pentatricopeptide repeat protein
MQQARNVEPNAVTFVSVLNACAEVRDLSFGKQTHSKLNHMQITDSTVSNALINMYINCGAVDTALEIFFGMQHRNDSSWKTIISSCIKNGLGNKALDLYASI